MAKKSVRTFTGFARYFWKIYPKDNGLGELRQAIPFIPLNSQRLMLYAAKEQRNSGKPIRLRILKYRQAGSSMLWYMYLLFLCLTNRGYIALSLADKSDLPAQWLRMARGLLGQIKSAVENSPVIGATNANEIWLKDQDSRYYIGSAEGTTPGMGATIQAVHCSEIASWRDPDSVMTDLSPAVNNPNSVVIQESTGRSVGDWWYQRYNEGKDSNCGWRSIFLPWFIQDEYKINACEILDDLSDRERDLKAIAYRFAQNDGKLIKFQGITDEQLAWRRLMIARDFRGDEDLFANQYPATEDEAFLSGGMTVFNSTQVRIARGTVRKPIWVGEIWPGPNPREYRLEQGGEGTLTIFEAVDERYHYAIGADCQWGTKDTSDFDAAVVECLETGKVVAVLVGKWDMGRYAAILASLGHHYNHATLAPERNSDAAQGVIAVLLGRTANNWRYANLWIRSNEVKLGGYKFEDYGWRTDQHTKPELIANAKECTMREDMDWSDSRIVDQMAAYIRDVDGKLTAPTGAHDDLLMARMIAAKVAQRERTKQDLWREPEVKPIQLNDINARLRNINDEE